ncbi:MAG: peptide deformylase [Rubrivivax sp.]|nr:peptide deformylase [Rubrivivax sp.]
MSWPVSRPAASWTRRASWAWRCSTRRGCARCWPATAPRVEAARCPDRQVPGEVSMTVREILKMGDPRLLQVAQPVRAFDSPELHALVADLFDTMAAAQGAGLAAPQIGVDLQVVIFGFERNARYPEAPAVPPTVLVNPLVTPLSDELVEGWEGCLSVPGLRGVVPRHARIRYRGWDARGELIEREVDGFHARVVQHECDHLIGRLYPTRMTDLTKLGFTSVLFPELVDAGEE